MPIILSEIDVLMCSARLCALVDVMRLCCCSVLRTTHLAMLMSEARFISDVAVRHAGTDGVSFLYSLSDRLMFRMVLVCEIYVHIYIYTYT